MHYVIKNHKDVYIRLNQTGVPAACSEQERMLFEYTKAKNIVGCLPKALKNLRFQVEPVPDTAPREGREGSKLARTGMIQNSDYKLSENVSRWVDKFGACADVFDEAKKSVEVLSSRLDYADKDLLDILHRIELEPPKDLYSGWKIYKRIRENRRARRVAKDELLIITNVLEGINPSCLQREKVQRAIDGLFRRKYKFRIVEEEDGVT